MPTALERIPRDLRALDRWVGVEGDSKVPLALFDGSAASVKQPIGWGSWDDVARAVPGAVPYAGFVFAGDGIVGVDIDDGFDEWGFVLPEVEEAVERFSSYTEVSRSGRGFHILCRGTLPFKGAKRDEWEVYSTERYFVLTGHTYRYTEVVEAQDAIDWLVGARFGEVAARASMKVSTGPSYAPVYTFRTRGKVPIRCTWPKVGKGGRHAAMVSLAGQLVTAGLDGESLLAEMRVKNRELMDPPLPDAELAQIARSTRRWSR